MRKVLKVDVLPKCAFCGADAFLDAPTLNGSWAYMCGIHSLMVGTPNHNIGTEFSLLTDLEKSIRNHPAKGTLSAREDFVTERVEAGITEDVARAEYVAISDADMDNPRARRKAIHAAIADGDFDAAEDLIGDGDISEWL
jgi:hypothetical protein